MPQLPPKPPRNDYGNGNDAEFVAGPADHDGTTLDELTRTHSGESTEALTRGIQLFSFVFASVLLLSAVALIGAEALSGRNGWSEAEYWRRAVEALFVVGVVGLVHLGLRSPRVTDDMRRWAAATLFLLFVAVGAYYAVRYLDVIHARLMPTWVSMVVLTHPLLVPGSVRYHTMLAVVAALAIPVAALLYAAITGFGAVATREVVFAVAMTSFGVWITSAMATIFAIRGERQRQRLARARADLAKAEQALERFGSYQLETRLGVGGMGEVWAGRHVLLKRPAAIKLVRPDVLHARAGLASETTVDDILARFEREAAAIAMLTSPNTVQLYDYGRTDAGTFYFAMELLHGMDLERFVRTFGPLPPERAIYLLKQACASLAEAHEQGLVHRDIKPQNLFVCRAGVRYDVLKVLDFGLVLDAIGATHASAVQLTETNAIFGTPSFMSPEQARNRNVDYRSDIYSLGCVAYFLLTGDYVFSASSPIERVLAHLQDPPIPMRTRRPDLDIAPELDHVILRCLEKDPGNRFRSMSEVARKLVEVPLSRRWTQEDAREWARRHPTVFAQPQAQRPAALTPPRLRPVAPAAAFGTVSGAGSGDAYVASTPLSERPTRRLPHLS